MAVPAERPSSDSNGDDGEDDVPCLYCSEFYSKTPNDGWIRCTHCLQWAHEACAGVDDDDVDFLCE